MLKTRSRIQVLQKQEGLRSCTSSHHRDLHERVAPRVNHLRNVQREAITTESENRVNINTWKQGNSGIALGVVAVQVKVARGRTVTTRALIDEGSGASIASREFVRKLGFTQKATEMLIAALDGETREKSERHQLKIVTRKNRIRSSQ